MAIQVVGSSYNATSSATAATTSTNNSLGKDAFLGILVSQLKYQNPLEPLKPDEFLSQLSQLTQVEQLTNLTSLLNELKTSGNMTQWISTIGKKVNVASDRLSKGDELTLVPASDYDTITVTLKNLTDGTTKEVTFGRGDELSYQYDEEGTVQVTSARALKDGKELTCALTVFKVVKGVISTDTGASLVFANDETYDASQVKIIRN